jgi:nucleoside-diphosphate-sugar epimerase
MRILVLGGTKFLGRHTVEAALERGHDVTLFNRGQTNPELFPEAEKLHGDRDVDLGALAGREFDAVVDTSGYLPRVVRATFEAIEGEPHYTFVSSISVYADLSQPPTESSPTAELKEETEDFRSEAYGPLKALCEQAVLERFPDAFVVRPGLIVGPWDPTGRFTYWPERVAEGGRVLAPAPPERSVQVIDARDLAAWNVDAIERRLAGTYNVVSPVFTFAEMLESCRRVADVDPEFVWVDPDFLAEQGVDEWIELPLWLHDPGYAQMLSTDSSAALANGLTIRPLDETVAATLAWVRTGEAPTETGAGLAREKERQVLDAWRSKD